MKEKILELLNEEIYELCDEFEPASVAAAVETIVRRLEKNLPTMGKSVTCELGKYIFKVNNTHGGFVSCSNEDTGNTGVSNTLYYPYYDDEDDDGLRNLISMMNEAFYLCLN